MSRRDALDRAFRRGLDAVSDMLGTTLDVYQPTESTSHAGTEPSYGSANDSVEAFVGSPEETAAAEASGTDVDLDAVAYVADDTGVTFDPYDVPGEGATEVVDTRTNDRYRVETNVTHKGRLELGLVGSDN